MRSKSGSGSGVVKKGELLGFGRGEDVRAVLSRHL